MRTRTLLVAAVFALVTAACGGGSGGDQGDTPSSGRPSSTAVLAIVDPANEATVPPAR